MSTIAAACRVSSRKSSPIAGPAMRRNASDSTNGSVISFSRAISTVSLSRMIVMTRSMLSSAIKKPSSRCARSSALRSS